jgi:hypothetical protein
MVKGTNLETLCVIFEDAKTCQNQLKQLMKIPVNIEQLHKRFDVLQSQFDTFENCKIFNEIIA